MRTNTSFKKVSHLSKIVRDFLKLLYLETEDVTLALAGFHAGPLPRSNSEMLVFQEGVKPEFPEKKPSEQGENQQQTQSTYSTRPESNLSFLIGGSRP